MEAFFLILGMLIGGVTTWYIVRLRMQRSHVSRIEFDSILSELNVKTTDLGIAQQQVKGLTADLKESAESLGDERETVLDLTGKVSSLTSQLESAEEERQRLQSELEKVRNELQESENASKGFSNGLARAEAELRVTKESLKDSQETARAQKEELRLKTDLITDLHKTVSSLNATVSSMEEKLATQKEQIETIGKKFETEFKNLANQILDEKSSKFTELNKTNLETLLKPLGITIESFKKQVEEVYEKESQQRFSLGEKVAELVTLNQKISEEANNLTHALEGSSKIQGDWGEWILESILERSGLVKGREFHVQEYMRDDNGNILKNEDGTKKRPDVIINYPDNRKVIVDSKVSLVAYKRMSFSDTPEEHNTHLQQHLASIKKHINDLSAKNYPDFAKGLDFVMMFIPIEPAFLVAMHADPELWSYAYSRRVLLISPTNLIAVIKIIADLWIREYQNRNAIEIAERGGALYDKFVGFVEALSEIGSNIERTQKSYDTAFSRLKDGRGNLLMQVESLKKLGVKARKTLPIGFEADLEEDESRLLNDDSSEQLPDAPPIDDQDRYQQGTDDIAPNRVDAF
jgi:DNA recombination protein RmuC